MGVVEELYRFIIGLLVYAFRKNKFSDQKSFEQIIVWLRLGIDNFRGGSLGTIDLCHTQDARKKDRLIADPLSPPQITQHANKPFTPKNQH